MYRAIKHRLIVMLLVLVAGTHYQSKLSAQPQYASLGGEIYRIDLSTCSSTLVIGSNFTTWFDIALSPANPNIIYGINFVNELYEINLTSSQFTLLSDFSAVFQGSLNSLVCDGNGTLYAANQSFSALYSYDIATSTWTYLATLNGYTSAGDLTFYNGMLYMSTVTNEIIKIDPVTFSIVSVTPMNEPDVFGLGVISNMTLCEAGSVSMIASSGGSLYTLDPATGVSTLLCPNIFPASSYNIGGIASVFEGINPPLASLQINATAPAVCVGSSTTLSVTADSYLWQPGNFTTGSITVQPAVTTTYSVVTTDSSGCMDSAQITIVVDSPITVSSSMLMPTCYGSCNGSATANVISGNGPFSYSWTPFPSSTSTASGLCGGQLCTCVVTSASGCSDTVSILITEPPPLSHIYSQTNVLCYGGNTGSATMIVSGGTPPYSHLWSTGGTGTTENNLSFGIYDCSVTDNNGCVITEQFWIGQTPPITATIFSSPQCGLNNGIASLSASGGTPGYTYAWSPSGGNSAMATGLTTGNYTCIITDANGCTQTQTVLVIASPSPTIVISSDTTISPGMGVTLTSNGGINYLWSPSSGLSCINCQNPIANPMQTTNYCVEVTDANGCDDSACVVVTVFSDCDNIFVPNAFSPNNDYVNDLLCVRGEECIRLMQFEVFDRWGEKVFASVDPDICWDGMLRGQPANVGVYVYLLNVTLDNGQQINMRGNISLVR